MDKVHEEAVARAEQAREPIIKVHFVSKDANSSNSLPGEDRESSFQSTGALEPPHNPETLCMLLEHSNALRQNIDAYQTNIDGFGNKYEPIIDLEAEDAEERIANALYLDRVAQGAEDPQMPNEQEVDAAKEKLRAEMRREKSLLETFFGFCCPDTSFVRHRRRTRQDLEVTGNAYWEVIRDKAGKLAQFVYVPAYTMRLLPLKSADAIMIDQAIRISELSLDVVERPKQFRRFVQNVNGHTVYFKELGDPRVMSRTTGTIYATPEEMQAKEESAHTATEILHFKIDSPRSAYGVPRWIGGLLAVLGNRQAEEVNFMYFENKSVPPLAVLVSGGRMTEEAVRRVQDFVDNEIKGKKNFHKILFLEADSDASMNSGQTKIEIKPLTQAQQSDALFQKYDERNIDKVGQTFRLPRMLRGDIRDFNRSTAEAALLFAEMQVFQPEREDFDWMMNRKILMDLGIRFWKFQSLGPISKDPEKLSLMIRGMVRDGILLPSEARQLAEDVFNKPFPATEEFWAHQPLVMTAAGYIPADAFDSAETAEPVQPNQPGDESASDNKEAAESDMSLRALDRGGKRKPSQGNGKARRFRRLPPIEKDDMLANAQKLIQFRDTVRMAEDTMAGDDFMLAKLQVDDADNEE